MERIDIVIITISSVLLAVALIMNFVASMKLSKLAATINEIESRMDKVPAIQPSPKIEKQESETTHSTKETTYIKPAEQSIDSRVARYRPPGSGTEGSGIHKTPRPAMSKAGIKLEPAPEKKVDSPAIEEDDVMDVVSISVQPEKEEPAKTTTPIPPLESSTTINPFIMKDQRIDFESIETASANTSSAGTVTIDMSDIPMMVESERISFRKVITPIINSGRKVVLLNTEPELKTTLDKDLPDLTYL